VGCPVLGENIGEGYTAGPPIPEKERMDIPHIIIAFSPSLLKPSFFIVPVSDS
jgi:hypothetical protein